MDLKLKNYSSGMQVRLGFAAAIQADADMYLVDEVLAVGDARFQEKCFDTFRQFKREGRTVIYVTHDLATVERLLRPGAAARAGEVVAIGAPSGGDPRRTSGATSRTRRASVGHAVRRPRPAGVTAQPRSSRPGSRTPAWQRSDVSPQGER